MLRKMYVVGYSFTLQVKIWKLELNRVWDWFDRFWHMYIMEHKAAITNPAVDLDQSQP